MTRASRWPRRGVRLHTRAKAREGVVEEGGEDGDDDFRAAEGEDTRRFKPKASRSALKIAGGR